MLAIAFTVCLVGSLATAVPIVYGAGKKGRSRYYWTIAASVSFVTAVWATRLLTFLAFEPTMAILSWFHVVLLPIGLTGFEAACAFGLMLFRPWWKWSPWLAGAGLGFGIGTAALGRLYGVAKPPPEIDYLVFIALMVAVESLAATMAFDVARRPKGSRTKRRSVTLLALALGVPISMMMTASRSGYAVAQNMAHSVAARPLDAWMVAAIAANGVVLLLFGFIVTTRAATLTHYREHVRLFQEKALHYDVLTDLPRARFLEERIGYVLSGASQGHKFACMCVSPSRFLSINESSCHRTGDALLVALAERLQQITRETDVVGKLGSDEFVILMRRSAGLDSVTTFAERVIDAFDRPFVIDGEEIATGANVGIALYPEDGGNAELLLRSAHIALGFAKASGRGRWRFFEPEMDEQVLRRRTLERDLESAVAAGQLTVQYQPLFDSKTRQVASFEALARWTHPTMGEVPPSEFISIAEGCGLIGRLGLWILETACTEAARWPHATGVAVNVSPLQLREDDFVAATRAILERTGLAPERLELEITESALIDNPDQATTLRELKALGVRLAIDDFGAGYSGLNYLRLVSFDSIKVDRSFIEGLETDKDTATIVRAIVGLGHSLRLTVTAEGVETPAQLRRVREHGCDRIQGFLLGRPMPVDEAATLFTEPANVHYAW